MSRCTFAIAKKTPSRRKCLAGSWASQNFPGSQQKTARRLHKLPQLMIRDSNGLQTDDQIVGPRTGWISFFDRQRLPIHRQRTGSNCSFEASRLPKKSRV